MDSIDALWGGVSPVQKISIGPGCQVPVAEQIRAATGITTTTVGLITGACQAEEIVATGKADPVALARGMLYNPRRPGHAAVELGAAVEAPSQYWRPPPHEHKNLFGDIVNGGRWGRYIPA